MRRSGFMLAAAFLVASMATFSPQLGDETQAAGEFSSLSKPERLLDTRSGDKVGELDGSGEAVSLTVGGVRGIPSGVDAVAMNVTAVGTEASDFGGFVTVYPCGSRPDASNLNFVSNQTVANSVIAPVSSGGKVCFYVYGKAHLLADASGYFTSGFESMTPKRIMDTRSDTKVGELDGSGMAYELKVAGANGVPSDVDAVALNVTAVGTEANDFGGFVTVYPCGTRPDVSNLNFVSGQTLANSVIAPVSSSGEVCFYVYGKAHLLADVSGYFTSGFSALTPKRILDTRADGKVGELDGTGEAYTLTVEGKGGLPSSGIAAVAINVTAVGTEASDFGGFVTVYPCGTRPDASNLNFVSNQTIPNSVVAPVHPTYGAICLYVYGKADLLVDVSGYLSSEATENSGGSSDSSDDSAGDSLPDPVTDRSRTSVLSTQTEKWSKFEALQPASDRARPRTAVRPQSLEIQFRSVGVVGLALPDQSSSGSGLLAVTAAGQALDALLSGSADIANFYSAPNGRYYVLFNQTVALETGGPLCRLAEVEASTGVPTCVDSDLDTINWNLGSSGYGNTPVQFDDDGDVYYSGSSSNTGKTVLRKFDGTSATDLINDNIDLTDFRVLDDGGVIMTGSTQNTSASWVRRLSAAGALANLATGVQASFIQEFADGNVYVGLWGGDFFGIKQYDTSTGRLKSKYWIGGNVNGIDRDVDNDADQICEVFDLTMGQGFCGNYGTQVSGLYSILGQKSFAIAGGSGQSGTRLMQYYPTVEPANSVISSVTRAQRVITAILIAGVDSDGVNMLTVYDTGSKQETILIDALNEVEIYNMTYVLSTNSVMFNGLRFSDNTYVVGEIDLG